MLAPKVREFVTAYISGPSVADNLKMPANCVYSGYAEFLKTHFDKFAEIQEQVPAPS